MSIRHRLAQRRLRRRDDAAWIPTRWALWAQPGPVLGYVLAVLIATALLIAGTFRVAPITSGDWIRLIVLAAGSAVHLEAARDIERLRKVGAEGIPYTNLKGMWTFAGVLILPPPLAVLLIVTTYVHSWLRVRRVAPYRSVFTASTLILAGGAGAVVLAAIRPGVYPGYPSGPLGLIAVVAAGLAYWFVNYALVAGAIMLSNPDSPGRNAVGRLTDQLIVAGSLGLGVATAALLLSQPWAVAVLLLTILGLHRALLVDQFQAAARTDPKTGLANAAFWHEIARREFAAAERTNSPLGVLYLDLDHFKTVNDTYGHLAGDQALQAVADELRHEIRGNDRVGRLGGEEFAILLPQTSADDTALAAERIRRRIENLSVTITTADGAVRCDTLTCSIGTANYPDTATTLDELQMAADLAMYHAKDTGRNRVVRG
ncbi:GGDEF domain-containing protein [Kribbella sandramycini]|uniref:Diguanylate cyclase (GGDEF)-like protein n=1 Tax=Kribbella sandramycini TaxID=60450 RepID=A0A7Y4KZG9_9ACTN|nr:GGDEF domain-containing protein [Kribbella sandramycini]MBB6565249.1 diguanylate cyclase (GGDEF)-like protein [Kribbella sandramycini]NOL41518.1 GGDEF domain-containing protein [Kribbella sandramycini]